MATFLWNLQQPRHSAPDVLRQLLVWWHVSVESGHRITFSRHHCHGHREITQGVVQCPWILFCYWSVSLVWSFNQLGLHSNGWSQFLHKPLPMPICFHYKGMLTPGLLKDSDVTFCSDGLCSSIFVFEDGSYKSTAESLANPTITVWFMLCCGSSQEYKAYALLKPTGSLSWIVDRVLFILLSEVATCYNHGTVLRNVTQ